MKNFSRFFFALVLVGNLLTSSSIAMLVGEEEVTKRIVLSASPTKKDCFNNMLVCKPWEECIKNSPFIWDHLGEKFKGDYPANLWEKDNIRKTVIAHYIRVQMNCMNTDEERSAFSERNAHHLINSPKIFHSVQPTISSKGCFFDLTEDPTTELYRSFIVMWPTIFAPRSVEIFPEDLLFPPAGENLKKHIESMAEKGDEKMAFLKIFGMEHGIYGFEKDVSAAREENNKLMEQGKEWAFEREIRYYTFNVRNPENARIRELNDKFAEKWPLNTRTRKIQGLFLGWHGYPKDHDLLKIEIVKFIEEKKWRPAHYLKAYGIRNGVYGFQKVSHEEFCNYIRDHQLAY